MMNKPYITPNLADLKIELNATTVATSNQRKFLNNLLTYLEEKEDELERIKAANNLFDGN